MAEIKSVFYRMNTLSGFITILSVVLICAIVLSFSVFGETYNNYFFTGYGYLNLSSNDTYQYLPYLALDLEYMNDSVYFSLFSDGFLNYNSGFNFYNLYFDSTLMVYGNKQSSFYLNLFAEDNNFPSIEDDHLPYIIFKEDMIYSYFKSFLFSVNLKTQYKYYYLPDDNPIQSNLSFNFLFPSDNVHFNFSFEEEFLTNDQFDDNFLFSHINLSPVFFVSSNQFFTFGLDLGYGYSFDNTSGNYLWGEYLSSYYSKTGSNSYYINEIKGIYQYFLSIVDPSEDLNLLDILNTFSLSFVLSDISLFSQTVIEALFYPDTSNDNYYILKEIVSLDYLISKNFNLVFAGTYQYTGEFLSIAKIQHIELNIEIIYRQSNLSLLFSNNLIFHDETGDDYSSVETAFNILYNFSDKFGLEAMVLYKVFYFSETNSGETIYYFVLGLRYIW